MLWHAVCVCVCGRVRCGKLHAVVCVLCSMLQVAALLRCCVAALHSLIIITHSCIQKTQRPQQTGSRGNGTRSTRSKKLLLKNYTTNTNTDTHTHTQQYTSTSESTLEAQTATKTMSVVDVFSFFIYQPAKIGSTIKVRTARVKCQRPAWPTASLHHSSPPSLSHSRERDTRWTVPVGQFCYRSSECSLLPPRAAASSSTFSFSTSACCSR